MPHSPKTTPAPWGFHRWWLSIQSIRLRATYSTRGLHALSFTSAICNLRQLSDRSLNPPGNFTISTVNLRGSRFGQAHTQGEAATSHWHPHAYCRLSPIVLQGYGNHFIHRAKTSRSVWMVISPQTLVTSAVPCPACPE